MLHVSRSFFPTHIQFKVIYYFIFIELVTVLRSNLFSLGDHIKQYLFQPDLSFVSFIKIGLRYYITPELIVQLNLLKQHLAIKSFGSL
ncbi:hypothetical protein C4579_00770 [Candidatus Microgenomates bacterium]|nr:MAG: hypothetical protein C4579_00770 [Candidatus Microgenomates bacterium]